MFRCQETGAERVFGCASLRTSRQDLEDEYGPLTEDLRSVDEVLCEYAALGPKLAAARDRGLLSSVVEFLRGVVAGETGLSYTAEV